MDVTPRLGLDAAISHHASGSVTYQVGSDTRTGRVRFWSFQMGVSLRGPRRGLSGALNERKPAHAVFNTDGLARGLCNPLEPPASRAAGRRSRTRPRCARGGAAVTPPPLPARCGRAMPPGWGTWCRSQAASDPELPRRGGSRATARGLPPERGPVGGRGGGAHRQPLPGTREAWPQRVGWLTWAKRLATEPMTSTADQRIAMASGSRSPARYAAQSSMSRRRRSKRSVRL